MDRAPQILHWHDRTFALYAHATISMVASCYGLPEAIYAMSLHHASSQIVKTTSNQQLALSNIPADAFRDEVLAISLVI